MSITTKWENVLVTIQLLIRSPVECFGSGVLVTVVGEYHTHHDSSDD